MLVCKALCFEACFAIVVYVWPFRVVLDESSISHRTNPKNSEQLHPPSFTAIIQQYKLPFQTLNR
jgi:hypothetical protein